MAAIHDDSCDLIVVEAVDEPDHEELREDSQPEIAGKRNRSLLWNYFTHDPHDK